MSQYFFGSGSLYGRQTGVATPTPIRFGACQGSSVDFSFENKPLYGQYQFPLYVARGNGRITGKSTFAQLDAQAFNALFFNESALSTTPVFTAIDEVQTVSACAATVTNNSTYIQDLGVINLTGGTIMDRVSSAPTGTGNYSCNETTGVYTFCSAMNNVQVAISYDYSSAGNGSMATITNKVTGSSPQFLMVLSGELAGKKMRLKLNAAMSAKLTFGTKLSDYAMPEFDFEAFADASGNVGQWSFSE